MGDVIVVKSAHSAEHALDVGVGDTSRVELGEGLAVDVVVGQEGGVGTHFGDRTQAWHASPGCGSGVRHERGVLDLRAHREDAGVGGIRAQPQLGPGCLSEACAFLVPVVDHDAEAFPVSGGGVVDATARGVLLRLEHRHRESGLVEGDGYLHPAGSGGHRAEGVARRETDRPADEHRARDDHRRGRPRGERQDAHREHGDDREHAPAVASHEPGDGDEGDERGDDRVDRHAPGRIAHARDRDDEPLGRERRDGPGQDEGDGHRADGRADRVDELPRAAADQEIDRGGDREGENTDGRDRGEQPHDDAGQVSARVDDVLIDAG